MILSFLSGGKLINKPQTTVRLVALAGVIGIIVYILGNTVSFIVQLFDLSSSEVTKFIKVIAALLNRPNLDLEFLPQEFEDLTPDAEGVYAYAPGSYHPILFRRSSSEKGAWEWSDDGRLWFDTDNFRESPNGVPEPPALVFILRLHVEHLVRRRLAHPASRHRRLPPPLATEGPELRPADAAPEALCCPISHGLMRCPVVTPSGTTFEYEYIRKWVLQHNTDPVNSSPLTEADLYPNLALRDMIDRWLRQGATPKAGAAEQQQQEAGAADEAGGAGGAAGSGGRGRLAGLPAHLLDLS